MPKRYENFAQLPAKVKGVVVEWEQEYDQVAPTPGGSGSTTREYILAVLNAQVGGRPADLRRAQDIYKTLVEQLGKPEPEASRLIENLIKSVEEAIGQRR